MPERVKMNCLGSSEMFPSNNVKKFDFCFYLKYYKFPYRKNKQKAIKTLKWATCDFQMNKDI